MVIDQARTVTEAIGHWARSVPTAPALLAPGRAPCTYGDLGALIDEVGAALAGGIGRSDAVAVVLPNGPEMAAAFLAVSAATACAPLNPAYTESEVGFYLDDLRARAVIVSADAAPAIAAARARGLLVVELAPRADGPAGTFALDGLPMGPGALSPMLPDAGDIALVLHTSGTTSRPKQVPLSHANVLASAGNVGATLGLDGGDRCLNVMPLFHIHGLIAALSASMRAGGSVVCTPGFDPERFFEWVDDLAPTWYTAVPTIHQAVLAAAGRRGIASKPGTFRFVRSSSASLPPSVMAALELLFDAPVVEAYGMTEAAHQMACNPLPPAARKPGTVGIAAGPEVAIIDEEKRFVAPGTKGEIVIRGENVTAGYVENPTANADAFFDGWFRTGDEGVFDEDGYLTITGRLKEIINRGGEKIAPREIEERLLAHPAVAQAVAFAAPHPTLGEDVAAAVVLKAGSDATPAELRAHVADALAPFKVPRQVLVRDALPLGATGKLQRIGMADRLGLTAPSDADRPGAPGVMSPLEGAVRGIWQAILGVEAIGLDDDFFALGGDSLAALEVVAHVRQLLRAEVPVSAVFEDAATVRGMAATVDAAGTAGTGDDPIDRVDEADGVVSFAEERLWFLDALDPDSAAYHVPHALHLRGPLDTDALERAVAEVLRRHDRLRTVFPTIDGRPQAVVHAAGPLTIPVVDVSGDADSFAAALRIAADTARLPFDLATGPLLRVALHRIADDEHLLLLVWHHIVTDAHSRRIVFDELAALYRAFAAGAPSPLPDLDHRFADLAAWQRTRVASDAGAADLAYWRERLADPPPPLELPADRPRSAEQPTEGDALRVELDGALRTKLVALAEANRATLFMTLLAGFAVLLHRLTGRTDITVGVPVSGRTRVEAENIVGLFVNTVVIRVVVEPGTPFAEVLRRVREASLGAYDHQAQPFERLVEELRPERDTAHTPLVQTFFHLRNPEPPPAAFGETTAEPVEIHAGGAKFELSVDVTDTGDSLSAHLEYPSALFDAATVRRIGERFALLLDDAASRPDTTVGELRAAVDDELGAVAEWGRGTEVAVPEQALHELIAARAAEAPDALAVVDGDRRLTRLELDRAANRFAHHLADLGVGPGDRVTVCLARSLEEIVAELGVLKVGAAFVPLDPAHPAARLGDLLEDTTPAAVVATADLVLPSGRTTAPVVLVDRDRDAIDACPDTPLDTRVAPDDPAWVLFTSGSTGRAKGVVGRHRTEVNRALWRARAFPPRSGEVHAHRVPPGFVDMVIEVYGALAAGLAVAVAPYDDVVDPRRLLDLLARHEVSRIIITPSHLRVLLDVAPDLGTRVPALWLWNISGEAVPAELVRRLFAAAPGSVVINTYGSTEGPNATFQVVDGPLDASAGDVAAGRPIDNVVVKVADATGRPAPIGVLGEIWTAGDLLAQGYLGDEVLTAARFVEDADVRGGRWYRTGDAGAWTAGGSLRYSGRIDRQVKVRGMRVELDEVESHLESHPDVREAAVVALPSTSGARLVGYVRGDAAVDVGAVRAFLHQRLPRHAVPADVVVVDDLPRTSTGKIDRRALAHRPVAVATSTGSRPVEPNEVRMAELWADLLERDPESITLDDDFFDLGGHSLLAIEMLLRVEQTFGVNAPLRLLFEDATLRALVVRLDALEGEEGVLARDAVPLAQGEPGRIPVFCVAGVGSTIVGWRRAVPMLDPRIPFFGLESVGLERDGKPAEHVEDLVDHHVEQVRAVHGDGPVILCGHSFGGVVAFELARRLAAEGQHVAGLVLLDSRASRKAAHQRVRLANLGGAIAYTLRRRRDALRRRLRLRGRAMGVIKTRTHLWTLEARRAAMHRWTPLPYDGPVVLLAVESWRFGNDNTLGWGDLAASVEVVVVPGDHLSMLEPESVESTMAVLGPRLLALSEPQRADVGARQS